MDLHYTMLALPYRPNIEFQRAAQFQALDPLLGPTLTPALRLMPLPNLKVGTLDSLIEASDELARLDPLLEGISFRLCSIVEEVGGFSRTAAAMVRTTNSSHGTSCDHLLKEFTWLSTAYDPSEPISTLCRKFSQVAQSAEERTKGILMDFSEMKNKLVNAQRKFTGSLQVKPIKEYVDAWCRQVGIAKPWDTDFFVTLFVVVPNGEALQRWQSSYASINTFVVPQSSYVLATDKDFTLVSLVCFKKVVEDVKTFIRKAKFFLREYTGQDDMTTAEYEQLQQKARQEKDKLAVYLSQQFSQCYIAWLHVKVARMFVEAHLKLGVTANFVPIILAVDEKKELEIKTKLDNTYKDFSNPFAVTAMDAGAAGGHHEVAGALVMDLAYVWLKVNNILRTR